MRVLLTGDYLTSGKEVAARLDPTLLCLLREADGVFTNAEFCVPKCATPPQPGKFVKAMDPGTLDEMASINLNLISFANNHSGDFGPQGIVDTIEEMEKRKMVYCGVGRSLLDARRARFLDTKGGRIGIVAANSTQAEKALAGNEGAEVCARAGLNPLRWERVYVLPRTEYEQMKEIDRKLGTAESMAETSRIEAHVKSDREGFRFGSAMDGYFWFEPGETAGVKTLVSETDMTEILHDLRDAKRRSDYVIASLHSHEGVNENWYSYEVPSFIEDYAHRAVDAGADVVAIHGAHFNRGVEIYKGHLIFYNLGSLFLESERGETKITPEMYLKYGLTEQARPSDFQGRKARQPNGEWTGFCSEDRFSWAFIAVLDIDADGTKCALLPLNLDMRGDSVPKRGFPEIADPETGRRIAAHMTKISEKYGTVFSYDLADGLIRIK